MIEEIKSLLMLLIGLVLAFGSVCVFHLVLIDIRLEKIYSSKENKNGGKQNA